jgi:hypothetical protein
MSCYKNLLLLILFSNVYAAETYLLDRLAQSSNSFFKDPYVLQVVNGSTDKNDRPLKLDCRKIKFNSEKKKLYYSHENETFATLTDNSFRDVIPLGQNGLVVRLEKDNQVSFKYLPCLGTPEVIESYDSQGLKDNQWLFIQNWGAHSSSHRVFVAWVSSLITAKNSETQSNRFDILEAIAKDPSFYSVDTYLNIHYINLSQNMPTGSLASHPIKNFPLDFRAVVFPRKILFSPDKTTVLIEAGPQGFILKSLLPSDAYPFEGFFPLAKNISNSQITPQVLMHWLTKSRFLILWYTRIVQYLFAYSKIGGSWYKDALNNEIEQINQQINDIQKPLLLLSFEDEKNVIVLRGLFEQKKKLSRLMIFDK